MRQMITLLNPLLLELQISNLSKEQNFCVLDFALSPSLSLALTFSAAQASSRERCRPNIGFNDVESKVALTFSAAQAPIPCKSPFGRVLQRQNLLPCKWAPSEHLNNQNSVSMGIKVGPVTSLFLSKGKTAWHGDQPSSRSSCTVQLGLKPIHHRHKEQFVWLKY